LKNASRQRLPRQRWNTAGRASTRSHRLVLSARVQACHHSQLPKKFEYGAWANAKSTSSWRMGPRDPAAEPVVVFDVGGRREQ
jgi:hypothetical protein